MASILETGKAAVKADLDGVAKNKIRAEIGSDGSLEGSVSTVRRGWTFTAYVKALVTGSTKSTRAGARVERDF